jgi:hypothetical protein
MVEGERIWTGEAVDTQCGVENAAFGVEGEFEDEGEKVGTQRKRGIVEETKVPYPSPTASPRLPTSTSENGHDSESPEALSGSIWFTSQRVLPIDYTEALQRLFGDSLPGYSVMPYPTGGDHYVPAKSGHPHITGHESGSESAIGSNGVDTGSDAWREAYALSTSDTDDDSELFSFRVMPRVKVTNSTLTGHSKQDKMATSLKKDSGRRERKAPRSISTECLSDSSAGEGKSRKLERNRGKVTDQGHNLQQTTPLTNVTDAGKSSGKRASADIHVWEEFEK